ncbi:ribosomal RNA small subunit methyltransferase A [Patescibacteria group bacterium]|nr:ribosomal RNA small subunit methyltransferase A [Patescibacteria group bacterium]MBU1015643.1 ribosomal RNA small subunit methyltransferase A [Patescibacteria group bacterium]MBU1684782.1 ribosomal RNA small subunit methyltransferase A [Patescibacteria group bacterium]MBU1938216.1 ribosomal RNA small subunit methyltransferase A [Patescibacteria group bacterium]
MSKLDQLKSQLIAKGLWAQKGLGQNFLIDDKALDQIIEAADLYEGDHVVEVGSGTGFLTERLIQKAGKVTSVELDRNMVEILKAQFSQTENLEVIHADILKTDIVDLVGDKYKVVANIPYYITSPVIRHFLQAKVRPKLMVVLVQKEVAEKICGLTGKSFITVETQLQGHPEYISTVPASSFYPAPKVDSAILKITVFPEPKVPEAEMKDFLRIVKFGYSQKRKKLSNGLAAGLHKEPAEVREILEKANISVGARSEELEIEDWKRLAEVILF